MRNYAVASLHDLFAHSPRARYPGVAIRELGSKWQPGRCPDVPSVGGRWCPFGRLGQEGFYGSSPASAKQRVVIDEGRGAGVIATTLYHLLSVIEDSLFNPDIH